MKSSEDLPKNARLIPINAERVFRGIIFDVYQWQQKMFDGSYSTFEMLKRPDTVQIIAIKDGKIVALREEQPGHSSYYGFPGGRVDEGDNNKLISAQRELAEETGMKYDSWELLDVEQPQWKIEWFVYTYLAYNFREQLDSNLDNGEKNQVLLIDFNDIKKLESNFRSKRIIDIMNNSDHIKKLVH
jgi:ADP-ribose pyrophosphatase